MKSCRLLPLAATLALASCAQIASTFQEPITSDFNPLDGPSVPKFGQKRSFQTTGPSFKSGEWVETAMPNSTFFNKIPRGNATADQVLSQATPVKVISTKGSFLKVELESGDVGYIPSIMVAQPSNTIDTTPFLPPPPSEPLSRSTTTSSSNDSTLPILDNTPLNSSGPSLIPPPSNFVESPTPTVSPDRSATEIVIPTSPPQAPTITPSINGSDLNLIPAPSSTQDAIDQTLSIE